jgi:cell division protein FtsB
MKRLTYVVLAIAALTVLGVFSSIVTHGFEELASAEAEKRRLEDRARELEDSIVELEATLDAIRNDPAAVESVARAELGMVRPGDTVILIATPTPPPPPPSLTGPTPTPILTLRE